NAVATFLEAVLPLAIAFIFTRRTLAVQVTGGVTALILLYAIFLTYSRGAYVGLAGAAAVLVVVWILYRLPRPVAYGTSLVALIIMIDIVFALYKLAPAQPLPLLGRPVDPRLTLYHNTLYLAQDYIFTGIGLGNTFAAPYSRYSLLIQPLYVSYPSNLLLSVWMNQGLLGLTSFIGMFVAFYVYVIRTMRR